MIGGFRIGFNLKRGLGHARRIGARQIAAIGQRLGGTNFKLTGFGVAMIIEGRLAQAIRWGIVHLLDLSDRFI